MTAMEKEKKPVIKEQDIMELLSTLWKNKRFIIRFTLLFFVFGVVLAVTSVKKYTVEVMVAPEASDGASLAGNLGSLASMVGIDLGAASGDAIYPLIYPDIVTSLPFLTSMMDVRVKTQDGVDTTYSYYQAKLQKKYWFSEVLKAPKKGLMKLASLFKKQQPSGGDPYVFDPYRLSKQQLGQVETLKNKTTIFVDKKTEVITLSFTDSDPEVAAVMAETMEKFLEEAVTEYRTKKAQKDCQYMEKLYLESKAEYEKIQREYAEYVDHNRNITLESVLIERQRLEEEKELRNTLYSQWAQQLMVSQAKLQHNTPVFTTLKPASVPAQPSSIRRLLVIFLYGFTGLVIAVLFVLLRKPFHQILDKMKGSEK